ncbi:hypothetical protein O181_096514 [Austropuccinia psidii MF-1]|uniref:Uncharacterized protein n=1 Tax=Austropuccinia psidii MF-1 TaxID=1389203 RepID=A0A9Q3J761_9BASI|nr:hypothetical protein [Austropuccinia psidii MF-1]
MFFQLFPYGAIFNWNSNHNSGVQLGGSLPPEAKVVILASSQTSIKRYFISSSSMSNKKAKIYQIIKEKNQEKLECNYDTEKSHPQNQSDSQNLEPGLFQPQNDFEKALSMSNSSPEVNSISQNYQSNIQSFPASTMRKKAKSKIEEPLIQPTSTKHSKEKPNSNLILVYNNP